MRQNDSKYHLLYLGLKSADDYFPEEDRKELLDLVKNLYNENQSLIKQKDDKGKFGINYQTIHDDSSWSDKHEQFFRTKSKRDDVYDDWIEGKYWGSIFEQYLQYSTPSPNVHHIKKVFRVGGKTYEEQV